MISRSPPKSRMMRVSSSDEGELFDEIRAATQRERELAHANRIPNYRILEEIHRGGQGVVFKAIQESTKRVVALKLMLHGVFSTERQRLRFEREIDVASRLRHPNIVTIFDGGISQQQPFCAMEFIDGKPLTEFLQHDRGSDPSTMRRSIELIAKICEAVGYAHSQGVIHRDIKPANILISADGEPHVVDFGLAKILDEDPLLPFSPRTMTGEFIGTLSYASPEQAQANPSLTDTRSDVYALGVVAYECLTGCLPYDVSGSIVQTLTNITSVEPIPLTRSSAGVDFDLQTIVMKALSKDPARRYQNGGLLAADLRRYLDGNPIDARRDSTWYVLRKTANRHKRVVVAALSFVGLLIFSLIAILYFYLQAVEDRSLARDEAIAANKARMEEATQRDEAEFQTYIANISAANASIRIFDSLDAVHNLDQATERFRDFEWWYLLGRVDISELSIGGHGSDGFDPQDTPFTSIDYHPKNEWLVSGGWSGRVVFWEPRTGKKLTDFQTDHGLIKRVRVSPDGNRIAVGFREGDAIILNVSTEQSAEVARATSNNDADVGRAPDLTIEKSIVQFSTTGSQLNDLAFSPDGKYLVLAAGTYPQKGSVQVCDSNSGDLIRTFDGHQRMVTSVAISADGKFVAAADTTIKLWDFESGELVREMEDGLQWINDLSFHPHENQLASCGTDTEIRIWHLATGKKLNSIFGHTSGVNSIEYSRDGSQLASVSEDKTLRIWDAKSFTPLSTKWGHAGGISDVRFRHDGNELATSGLMCIKTWNPDHESADGFGNGLQKILDVTVSPDATRTVACDERGSVLEFSLQTNLAIHNLERPSDPYVAVRSVAYSPDGGMIAWAREDGKIGLWLEDQQSKQMLAGHTLAVNSICFSRDGTSLFSASDDMTVRVWDLTTATSDEFCRRDNGIKTVMLSPDNRWLATLDTDCLTIWDVSARSVASSRRREDGSSIENFELAFSPNGSQIAAADNWYDVKIWSVPAGEELATLRGGSRVIESLAFAPTGNRIALSFRDGTIQFWDSQRFQPVFTLRGFSGYGESLEFSSDNVSLVAGMYGGKLRHWKTLDPSRRKLE